MSSGAVLGYRGVRYGIFRADRIVHLQLAVDELAVGNLSYFIMACWVAKESSNLFVKGDCWAGCVDYQREDVVEINEDIIA